LLKCY